MEAGKMQERLPYPNAGFWFTGMLLLVLLGFADSYFLVEAERHNLTTHLHSVLMTMWLLLVIVQAFLVRAGKMGGHRLGGRISILLAPMMVFFALAVATEQFGSAAADPDFEGRLRDFWLAFWNIVIFAVFFALAVVKRKQTAVHARYVIAATLTLLPMAAFRLFARYGPRLEMIDPLNMAFLATEIVLMILIALDATKLEVRGPYILALPLVLLWHLLQAHVGGFHWWASFAVWFNGTWI
jgi:hypothetical protein